MTHKEWFQVRTFFAWRPVYLNDTKEYAWLETVYYHRISDYHWNFINEYYSDKNTLFKRINEVK